MQPTKDHPMEYITLESIAEKKAELRIQLEESRKSIQQRAKEIFAPATSKGSSSFMSHISSGIAIFDGVMTGLRIMRKIRNVFSFHRRY